MKSTPNDSERLVVMPNDPRKDERDLILQMGPVINMMGLNDAAKSGLGWAVKAQLTQIHQDLTHYIPTTPRGWGDDSQMPHEWGSMDSYDDCRNALFLGLHLMEGLMDVTADEADDYILRGIQQMGVCATAEEIINHFGGSDKLWDLIEALPEEPDAS